MSDQPIELIVRGVLLHEGQVLLCQNRKHGHLFLPGGHVDFNEPAGVALLREIREEIGIDLNLGRFLGAVESAFDQQRKKSDEPRRHHEVNLVFQLLPIPGQPFNPEALQSKEDHIQFLWAPVSDLGVGRPHQVLPLGIESLIASNSDPSIRHDGAGWVSHFT